MCVSTTARTHSCCFCHQPVSSALVFISWLFTFSSDTACQTSPQDIPQKKDKRTPPKTIHTIQQPYDNLHLSERRRQENSGGGKNRSSRDCFLTSCMYKTLHAFRCGTLNVVVVFLFVSFFLFSFPPSR